MKHLGDITKISGHVAPIVDCVIGGSPCQDLSVAGKRAGLDGERSGLYIDQVRIVKEMRERDERDGRTGVDIRPRYMVWENVPGAFSSNKGEDFRIVLEELAKVADKDAVIPRPADGKWTSCGCIMGDGWSIAWRVLDSQFWGVAQRRRRIALIADFGGHSAQEILFVRESVSGDIEPGRAQRKRTACDAEGSPIADHREGEDAGDGRGLQLNAVMSGGFCPEVSAKTRGIGWEDEKSPTLRSGVVHGVVTYDARGNGNGTTVCTITGDHCNRVTDYTPTVVYALDRASFNQGYIVRRLTPLECERLQGFPDGWTDIGEWVDSKGKKHQTSDAARYKALGNSIALPPWKWVLKRLCACYERDATMASLFDGIGGFPYLWEQLNGKGSCLWASEIEDFPIAVTERRFNNAESK